MAEKRIFFKGTLEEVDGKLVQVGNVCKKCGKISFPQGERCLFCGSGETEKKPIATEGTLYSYSITRRPVGPFEPPFAGGYVDLPDDVRVYGQIHTDPENVKVGMKLKAEVGTLYTEEDGTEVVGYYYVPAE